jgi:hypothetical protein
MAPPNDEPPSESTEPPGLTVSEDGQLINWNGQNYIPQPEPELAATPAPEPETATEQPQDEPGTREDPEQV